MVQRSLFIQHSFSLADHFRQIAKVRKATVVMERENESKSRGFGFVEFCSMVCLPYASPFQFYLSSCTIDEVNEYDLNR